jgi:hypothetical protein
VEIGSLVSASKETKSYSAALAGLAPIPFNLYDPHLTVVSFGRSKWSGLRTHHKGAAFCRAM